MKKLTETANKIVLSEKGGIISISGRTTPSELKQDLKSKPDKVHLFDELDIKRL